MRWSAAPLVRALAVAALSALPFALIGACSGESGVTPDCTINFGKNGVVRQPDGCYGFAICDLNPNKPEKCCTGDDGQTLTGDDLALCLYGYGAGPAPTSSASTSTGSSSSTSSSSTTGGGN